MATKKRKFDVITVGSAVRDVVFYTDEVEVINNPKKDPTKKKLFTVEFGAKLRSEDVIFSFGGGGCNTAVNFAGLGLRAAALTAVGDDFDGVAIRQHLESKGVNTDLLITCGMRTGFSFLLTDKKTGEHTAHVYYGAAGKVAASREQLAKHPTNWYYMSSFNTPKWKVVVGNVLSTGANVAWNPGGRQLEAGYVGLKRFFPKLTVFNVNMDEATELVMSHPDMKGVAVSKSHKKLLEIIQSWGPQIVIITDGRKGSFAYDGEKHYFQKTPSDKPVDTTGAGDCYGSSFVAGHIRYKGDIQKAMKLATTNATHLVHEIGAQNGLLTWKQLPASLRKR